MSKYSHLVTAKEYAESEGIELTEYWVRWLGQVMLSFYQRKYGEDKKPPRINRKGFKGRGYDPVTDPEIFGSALGCYRIAKNSKESRTPLTAPEAH